MKDETKALLGVAACSILLGAWAFFKIPKDPHASLAGGPPPKVEIPEVSVGSVRFSDCSSWTQYCTKVQCSVTNLKERTTDVEVVLEYISGAATQYRAPKELRLRPGVGFPVNLTHTFDGAHSSSQGQATCTLVSKTFVTVP